MFKRKKKEPKLQLVYIPPREVKGAWFVYMYNVDICPFGFHEHEVDARRQAMENYAHAVFWPFGATWDEVK